jgi:Arc/MetJ family transcription regulator
LSWVKTTVDLDEEKLERLMRAAGIKTRKEAIDFALTEAERIVRLNRMMQEGFYVRESGDVLEPGYDLKSLRADDRPGS